MCSAGRKGKENISLQASSPIWRSPLRSPPPLPGRCAAGSAASPAPSPPRSPDRHPAQEDPGGRGGSIFSGLAGLLASSIPSHRRRRQACPRPWRCRRPSCRSCRHSRRPSHSRSRLLSSAAPAPRASPRRIGAPHGSASSLDQPRTAINAGDPINRKVTPEINLPPPSPPSRTPCFFNHIL